MSRVIFNPLVILMFLAMAALAWFATVAAPVGAPFATHGFDKHQEQYTAAENCGRNPQMTMFRSLDNRYADICMVDGSLFTFIYEIQDGVKRGVTGLEKAKMSRIEQVIKWLNNSGYTTDLP